MGTFILTKMIAYEPGMKSPAQDGNVNITLMVANTSNDGLKLSRYDENGDRKLVVNVPAKSLHKQETFLDNVWNFLTNSGKEFGVYIPKDLGEGSKVTFILRQS